jgi:hypothetical protein
MINKLTDEEIKKLQDLKNKAKDYLKEKQNSKEVLK